MSSYDIISFKASELPKTYEGFVYDKWLRSNRNGSPGFKNFDPDEYYKHWHKFITMLMSKPDSIIKLAVLSDDHDVALGFSVSREDVLDYIYVHKDHRKLGIGTRLMPKNINVASHVTVTGLEIKTKVARYSHIKINPFA